MRNNKQVVYIIFNSLNALIIVILFIYFFKQEMSLAVQLFFFFSFKFILWAKEVSLRCA